MRQRLSESRLKPGAVSSANAHGAVRHACSIQAALLRTRSAKKAATLVAHRQRAVERQEQQLSSRSQNMDQRTRNLDGLKNRLSEAEHKAALLAAEKAALERSLNNEKPSTRWAGDDQELTLT